MNNNRFNFRRFWQLLSLHFEKSRKTNLLILSLVFFGTVVVLLFSTLLVSAPKEHLAEIFPIAPEGLIALSALSNASWIVIVVSFVFVCNVFANMSKRSEEMRYLTLPATNAEKWLSRVVYAVVVGVVLVFVCQNLAIWFCVAIGWIFDVESLKLLKEMAFDSSLYQEALKDTLPAALFAEAISTNVVTKFFIIAFLLFGGTAFRRTPWLYTALVLFGSLVVFITIWSFGHTWYIKTHPEAFAEMVFHITSLKGGKEGFAYYFVDYFVIPTMRIWKMVAPVLAVIFLWLSYRLFCRRQIACKKIKLIR